VETLYRDHFGFVWATLRRLGVPDRDLEDVAQEVFIVVHRRLDDFEGRSAVRTWLYAITMRVAYNHLRRHRRRGALAPVARESAEPVADEASDPEAHASRTEAGRVLYGLLDRLDADKRAVFVLADIEGLTAPEIATIVGANPRTVYSRLRVAREQFYAGLARHRARVATVPAQQRWVRGAAANDRPPEGAQRRVWAALLLRAPESTAIATTTAATSFGIVAQSIGLSLTIAAAGLGAIALASASTRAESRPVTAAADPATAHDSTRHEPPTRPETAPHAAAPELAAAPSPAPTAVVDLVEPAAVATPTPRPSARAKREPTPDDPLAAETALLEDARLALRNGDAARALRLTQTHAARFPAGVLGNQRDRTKLQALCALDRRAQAQHLADALGLAVACEG
jgi:RNA polymerase sigma-70 factor (ECF subfamily)